MEVARPFFHTPQPQQHLAELRIEADQSPVAFSDPCAVGRKRRCLFPAFSPLKKMLLELPPFPYVRASSPPARTERTARVGSNVSFAFRSLPKPPLAAAGSNSSGALASHERPLTPMGSTASSGSGILASQPSLSPGPGGPTGTATFALLASPKPVHTGTNDGGRLTFLASPHPAFERTASPGSAAAKELAPAGHGVSGRGGLVVSPSFVLSASRTSASPVRNSDGGTLWSRRRRSQQQWEEQLQIIVPPQKVAKRPKTDALATGEPPRGAAVSESSAKTCCTFLNSPARASKQDAQKAILAASDAFHQPSPAGTCCTFVTSTTSPSSVEKASKPERGVRVSSVAGEGPTSPSPAACPGAGVLVRVTCSCGARKEFSFDHCH